MDGAGVDFALSVKQSEESQCSQKVVRCMEIYNGGNQQLDSV